MSIQLTAAAAQYINKIVEQDKAATGLRLKVKESGCSGYSYVVDLAREISDDDVVFTDKSIKIVVDKHSLEYVKGTIIDYKATGINWALTFNNPNADMHCGCGESFNLKKQDTKK